MSTATHARATLADLSRIEGKAELIGGRIVPLMPTGFRPNQIAARIYRVLDDYAAASGRGFAFTDNMGFAVPELPSGRETFSPDASYYLGPPPTDAMDFVQAAPTFAIEVRSKGDHGEAAELEMAAKRSDYFLAGTLLVWDVDPRDECIRAYSRDMPDRPVLHIRGEEAGADPVLPGFRIAVDAVFA